MQGVPARSLAVTVARFQTHTLTEAHRYLLAQIATRAPRALVLLGVPPVTGRFKDPLEFSLRQQMVVEYWTQNHPDTELFVVPAFDSATDMEWAVRVDQTIAAFNMGGPVTLYGGHDSACEIYKNAGGKHGIEILDNYGTHATKVRAALLPRSNEDFRAGIIYQNDRRIVSPFSIVDVAVFTRGVGDQSMKEEHILLGRKTTDGDYLRLVGGFVDASDASLEQTARREVSEETGVEIGNVQYAGSGLIPDWRWRGGPEAMMSAVFIADLVFGTPRANDDLHGCAFYTVKFAITRIHPNHKELLQLALAKREATREPAVSNG